MSNNMKKRYFSLWRELSGWRMFLFYLLHYSVIFAIVSFLCFFSFIQKGKSLMWIYDGGPIYFSRLVYINKIFRDLFTSLFSGNGWHFPYYDFQTGIIRSDLQFEPLQLIAVLWPQDKLDKLYDFLVILRYYLAGVSFSLFGFYYKQKPLPIMAGAISYAFCGFAIFCGVTHPFFLMPMIYFPLLIICLEKTIKNEKPFLLTGIVCISIISTVYFSYMMAIFSVIFCIVRLLTDFYSEGLKKIGTILARLALFGGLGILLGGAIFIPTVLQYMDTGRVGRMSQQIPLLYNSNYYLSFLAFFFIIPFNFSSWSYAGFSLNAYLALKALFVKREKEHRILRRLFIILTVIYLLPVCANILSGFDSFANRWCFIYAFCVSAIIMFMYPKIDREKKNRKKKLSGAYTYLLLAVISAVISSTLYYSDMFNDHVATFIPRGTVYEGYEESQYESFRVSGLQKEDTEFYRVGGDSLPRLIANASFYYDINGATYFLSTRYSPYVEWWEEMELTNMNLSILNQGIIARSPLLSLMNIKYYVMREENSVMPYGFESLQTVENGKIKDLITENTCALPLGYTYSSYIDRESYDRLSSVQKQEALLSGILLEKEPRGIEKSNMNLTSKKISSHMTGQEGLTWENNTVTVGEGGGQLTISFDGLPETETFLRIVNMSQIGKDIKEQTLLRINTANTAAEACFTGDGYLYATGLKNMVVDLGYTREGYQSCTVTFPEKGVFTLEDLEIYCQPMDHYEEHIASLREEPLENIVIQPNRFRGTVEVSQNKMLCLALPYDISWKAYVDGQEAEIYRANTGFLAVELNKGNHEVEFVYRMSGQTAGILMSAFGVISLISLAVIKKRQPEWLCNT